MPEFTQFSDDVPERASQTASRAIEGATDWQSACRHLIVALEKHEQALDDMERRLVKLEGGGGGGPTMPQGRPVRGRL